MSAGWRSLPDLAGRMLGGGVVDASDEFFGAADNLLTTEPPRFTPHSYGLKGQTYDGWETRRSHSRESGYDYAIVRLGAPGIIRGVVVDTGYFVGNYPTHASVAACAAGGYPDPAELRGAPWTALVPCSPLQGDTCNEFQVDSRHRFTHVRLRIYPDGGVARLRVHGEVVPDPALQPGRTWDLAAMELGAQVVDCSDMFYGAPGNLIAPGPARTMGEGWETSRRRDSGNDWVLLRLATPGRIRLAEFDTSHFKGNAPAAASLGGIDTTSRELSDSGAWFELLPRTRLQPDTRHRFRVYSPRTASHVRLDIFPDGGMARLRLYGKVSRDQVSALTRRLRETQPPAGGS